MPGFDRMPPGTSPLEWAELQRLYGRHLPHHPGAGGPPGHIPGIYPPASLASDLIARERERIERLGGHDYFMLNVTFPILQIIARYKVK